MRLGFEFGTAVIALALTTAGFGADLALLSNGYAIRHDRRVALNQITRLYTGTTADSYIDVPTAEIVGFQHEEDTPEAAAPPPISTSLHSSELETVVSAASSKHGLDSDFINSVIHAESSYNPHAVSPKGARGLMQLMPQTASRLGVTNPFDPAANVDGGTRYLRELLDYYHNDVAKALAAYNAGPRRVAKYHGVPPYQETHSYVRRVISDFNRRKLAQRRKDDAKSSTAVRAASP